MAPKIPYVLSTNKPIIAIFICAIDEYAIIRFTSIWRKVDKDAKITPQIDKRWTNGEKYMLACENKLIENYYDNKLIILILFLYLKI